MMNILASLHFLWVPWFEATGQKVLYKYVNTSLSFDCLDQSNETIVDADYIQKFQKRLMCMPQSSIQNILLCSKVLCITKP